MFRELLLFAHLLAISLGEGTPREYIPFGVHSKTVVDPISHIYTGAHRSFLRDAPGLRARGFAGYYAGKSIAPIDGRIAAIDGRLPIAGSGAFYSPLNPAIHGLFGTSYGHYRGHLGVPAVYGVDGTKVVQRPLPPAPVTVRESPIFPPPEVTVGQTRIPPPPPVVQQVVKRPLPPPSVQQVVDRPPIRRPDPAAFYGRHPGLYAPNFGHYSQIYGGSYLHPYSYGTSPFYGSHGFTRSSLISGAYPHHAQSIDIAARRQEEIRRQDEIRRRAAHGFDGRLAYTAGKAPFAPAIPSHLGHLYSHNAFQTPHSLYGYNYGDFYSRLSDPRLRYRNPVLDPRGINAGIRRPVHFGSGIADPRITGHLGYSPLTAHHYDSIRHLHSYRPSSVVSPFSYGFAGLGGIHHPISSYAANIGAYRGYIGGPIGRAPYGIPRPSVYGRDPVTGAVKGPSGIVPPPPPVVPQRRPVIPRPEVPVVPTVPLGERPVVVPDPALRNAAIYSQVKSPIVAPVPAPVGGLAGVVGSPAFYQPRRLPELLGRTSLYTGEPYVQPRRLPAPVRPIISAPAIAPNYASVIAQQKIARPVPVVTPERHIPLHTPYTSGFVPATKVVEPVVAHDPFPAVSDAEVQKSIHAGAAIKG